METKFIHKISKGSRFNQIYIPKEMESSFKAGSMVEIRLVETSLFYSKNLKIGKFKEELIKNIFETIQENKEIEQTFIIGSFLTSKVDYNDIDVITISKNDLSDEIFRVLTEKFNLKFHVISLTKENLEKLLKIDPLTRGMFYYYVSDSKLQEFKREIDKKHLQFLLMTPEDLLKLKTNGKMYYDSIRRLIAIEKFLKNKEEDPIKINSELKNMINPNILKIIKENESPEGNALEEIRKIIKNKLNTIQKII